MRAKYDRLEDIRARLDSTICRYEDIPYFVVVDGRSRIQLYDLRTFNGDQKIVKTIKSDDEKFDISTVPLGYVNRNGYTVYVYRKPLRRYKQGIDNQSLGYHYPHNPNEMRLRENITLTESFYNMIVGDYPSLDEVFDNLTNGVTQSQAFSRDIAMSINKLGLITVHHKREEVGWIAPGQKTVRVPSNDMGWVVSKELAGFNWEID